jgi:hypothetical protein
MNIEPITPRFDPADIDDLRSRLRRTRRSATTDDDWARGVMGSMFIAATR